MHRTCIGHLFTYGNIHVSILFFQIIPPSPSPTESKSLYFTSVSLFLSCIYSHHYRLSQSHVNKCINILYWCFSFWLTSLCIIGSSFIHLIRTDSTVFFFYSWIVFHCVPDILLTGSIPLHLGKLWEICVMIPKPSSLCFHMSRWSYCREATAFSWWHILLFLNQYMNCFSRFLEIYLSRKRKHWK